MAMRWFWFTSGAVLGLSVFSLSFASVPTHGRVTDDTVIYENLSEIRVKKERDLNFDSDISRLSSLEDRYREHPRMDLKRSKASSRKMHESLKAPMSRVSQSSYRYSGRYAGTNSKSTIASRATKARALR